MALNAVIGALRVNLGLDSAEFERGLSEARRAMVNAGRQMQEIGGRMSLAITAPLVGAGTVIIRTAASFEASMNRVRAALGASDEEFAALEQAAKDLGETTQFSASEAADAIETLAKNGLSAAQILGGALEASLALAAASGTDLASAGDIATDVMLQFGKSAEDLGGVVDGITGVLLASKFGIDDYRLALAQAGGVAGGLGVEFEDFNAAIAATSSLFASGSDAGTSFKTFLQRLVPQSESAAGAMNMLGLEFFEADGSMKSMAEVAQELQDALAGLSEEARNEVLTTIFGADALRTAIGLANQGADGINRLSNAIRSASATEQAQARMEGFEGAVKELRSALEGLALAIAGSGLLEFMTDMVEGLTHVVRYLSDTNPEILRFGTAIAAAAAAIGPILIVLGTFTIALGTLGAPVIAAAAGIAALTAAVVAFWPEIKAATEAVVAFARDGWEWVQTMPQTIADAFAALPGQMVQIGSDVINGLWQGIQNKWAEVKQGVMNIPTDIANGFRSLLGIESPSRVMAEIGGFIMDGLRIGMDSGRAGVQAQTEAIGGDLKNGFDDVAQSLGSQFSNMFTGLIQGTTTAKQAIGQLLQSLGRLLTNKAFNSLFSSFGGTGIGSFLGGLLGRANGGPIPAGEPVIVGERGPEIVVPRRGAYVMPNRDVEGASAGGETRVVVELSGDLDARIVQGARGVAVDVVKANNRNIPGIVANAQKRSG